MSDIPVVELDDPPDWEDRSGNEAGSERVIEEMSSVSTLTIEGNNWRRT